jgi:hypothetical protein
MCSGIRASDRHRSRTHTGACFNCTADRVHRAVAKTSGLTGTGLQRNTLPGLRQAPGWLHLEFTPRAPRNFGDGARPLALAAGAEDKHQRLQCLRWLDTSRV